MVWSAVVDAVYRLPRMTGTTGRGLRGGQITVTPAAPGAVINYRGARFTDDVAISGRAELSSSTSLTATIRVTGPHGTSGNLTIQANLWDPAHPLTRITGTLGGHHVTLTTQTR